MNGWLDPANYGPHSRQWLGHYFRYHLAAGFLEIGDTVLDAACGVGYGSRLLAEHCRQVIALDADARALDIARRSYAHPRVSWAECDLAETESLPAGDVAVSFETIEHLACDPARFAGLLHQAARRLVILSAPVVPTVGVNPHHQHDFSAESLRETVVTPPWVLFEECRQGPYLILVAYRHDTTDPA